MLTLMIFFCRAFQISSLKILRPWLHVKPISEFLYGKTISRVRTKMWKFAEQVCTWIALYVYSQYRSARIFLSKQEIHCSMEQVIESKLDHLQEEDSFSFKDDRDIIAGRSELGCFTPHEIRVWNHLNYFLNFVEDIDASRRPTSTVTKFLRAAYQSQFVTGKKSIIRDEVMTVLTGVIKLQHSFIVS